MPSAKKTPPYLPKVWQLAARKNIKIKRKRQNQIKVKKASDPRHQKRIRILKDLFALSFLSQRPQEKKTKEIWNHRQKIDKLISKAAPLWPIEKINKVDLAILRLAVYELTIEKTEPLKVIIDEAVELAKEFGNEQSGPFVNGVLGTIVKNETLGKRN